MLLLDTNGKGIFMARKILVLFSILAALISLSIATPTFAASAPKPLSGSLEHAIASDTGPIDIMTLEKTCAVIGVELKGAQHAVTCRQPRSSAQSGVAPLISRDNSCEPEYDQMVIRNTMGGQPALVCFKDRGYAGVQIYHVNEVDDVIPLNTNGWSEWFRWYNGGPGSYYSLYAGDTAKFGTGVTNVEVTQVCIGTANWPNC